MKILALDFGASNIDAIVFNGQAIVYKHSLSKQQYSSKFLRSLPPHDRLITTGGKPKPTLPHLNEFDSLAQGGLYLSRLKSAVVVSCGTGTAVVLAKKNQPSIHLGGTAVGGGTLTGLGRLILKTDSPQTITSLAKTGNRSLVDLTVKDILGQGIGLLPPQATAANFAKLKSTQKPDLAASLVNMIAETIGLVSCLAAKTANQTHLVFVGRVAANRLIQTTLKQVCRLFRLTPHFPADSAYATALGAAVLTTNNPLKS